MVDDAFAEDLGTITVRVSTVLIEAMVRTGYSYARHVITKGLPDDARLAELMFDRDNAVLLLKFKSKTVQRGRNITADIQVTKLNNLSGDHLVDEVRKRDELIEIIAEQLMPGAMCFECGTHFAEDHDPECSIGEKLAALDQHITRPS